METTNDEATHEPDNPDAEQDKADRLAHLRSLEDAFKAVADDLIAKGHHWYIVAAGMSGALVPVVFDHGDPAHFKTDVRALTASQIYLARRYQKEIIDTQDERLAKAMFDQIDAAGHGYNKA